jgi:hypothetical protein
MTANTQSDSGVDEARTELSQHWIELFGQPPPPKAGQKLMEKLIAYELQTREVGGLSPSLRRRLADLAAGRSTKKVAAPGSQLVREWNGEQHVVEIEEDGFRWKGQVYSSLTSIAQAITGAKWSGPRFFGLRK